ncbi:MAG TPA: hypothetical protein GXX22_01505 [Clostridiales bacterium]|nr:hypothetical protein [Clostridiales bacterium]
MKKFKFSLDKVLEYRNHLQRREKDILARLRTEYSLLLEEERQLLDLYEKAKRDYEMRSAAGLLVADAAIMLNHIDDIKKQIELQRAKIIEKEHEIEKQTKKVVAITQDKMTVEKLREKKFEIYTGEVVKSEEKFIEDFIANRKSIS